jgi:AcrR family transcriptional regulator
VILDAASDLFHRSGFHMVGMDEIGEAAGVSGPAIYSHFPSKTALLVEIMERTARKLTDVDALMNDAEGPGDAVERLVAHQVDFAINNRALISIWVRETHSLPPDEQQRLREQQRSYLKRWVSTLRELHPDTTPAEGISLVQGAFNLIGSIAFYEPRLSQEALRELLTRKATDLLVQR